MIIFPVTGEFMDLGPMGVSMFFVSYVIHLLWPVFTFDGLYSTIVSQLVYSAGASGFAGANGSMMIEVVVSHSDSRIVEPLGHTIYTAFLSHNGHSYCSGHWRG
jgi:hypothetical protein